MASDGVVIIVITLNSFVDVYKSPSSATTVLSSVTLHMYITQHSRVMYRGITDVINHISIVKDHFSMCDFNLTNLAE